MYYADLIQLILVHNPKQIDIWYPIMLKQVYLGYFPNKYLFSILENYYNKINYNKKNKHIYSFGSSSYSYTLNNNHIIVKLDSLEESRLNKVRKHFFLEPYLDEEKKKIWQFQEETNYRFYMLNCNGMEIVINENNEFEIQVIDDEEYIQSLIKKYGENNIIIYKK
jgi:hypothetical protein